jgi:hypothetical protein
MATKTSGNSDDAIREVEEGIPMVNNVEDPTISRKFKFCARSASSSSRNTRCTITMNKKYKWYLVFACFVVVISLLGVLKKQGSDDTEAETSEFGNMLQIAGEAMRAQLEKKLHAELDSFSPLVSFAKDWQEKQKNKTGRRKSASQKRNNSNFTIATMSTVAPLNSETNTFD